MPPLAIPFKLRAKLYKNTIKDYWAPYRTDVWIAELTQRAPGLLARYHFPIFIEAATREEAAQKAREEYAKLDIQVTIK